MSRLLLVAAAAASVACNDGVLPPLSLAARRGDLAAMRGLLDDGADPNDAGTGGTRWPPVMHAVHNHQLEAARLLLESGADPDGAGPRGYTALMMAAAERDPSMLTLLLDHGADPFRIGPGGMTALSEAVIAVDRPLVGHCHPDTVRVLLDRVPDLALSPSPASREARFWIRLHAGLQKMRNVALVPTTGAAPDFDCGVVMTMVERRSHP